MQPIPSQEEMPFVDLPTLRETYASHTRLTHFDGVSVFVELAYARPSPLGPTEATQTLFPVARLVLSPLAAAVLHGQLGSMIPAMEKIGLLKRVTLAPEQKQ